MAENFSFGYWLKRQRKARDMTQAQLAQLSGVATVTLRKIEADERRPSLQLVQRLAEIFELNHAERETLLRVARADLAADQLTVATQPFDTPALPTGTLTFLFTDIEGSTKLWEQHPTAMRAALARHDTLLRQAITAHDGHIFKTVGDAVCAVFTSAPDALGAALDAQRAPHREVWGVTGPLHTRMALHTGVVEVHDGDYLGPPLNRLARLLAAGHGGQILLSHATAELVHDQLPSDVELRDLGARRLKDLTRPEQIWQVVAPDLPATFPPLRTLEAQPNNLPAQPNALIGRAREMTAVCALLRRTDVRLVTLTGPGGTGKTRLALQVGSELLDEFAHGVWFVNLAPIRDPALVVPAIAQALGVRETPGQPILESLKATLREKQLLLLLDNFEQVVVAAPLVAELLATAPQLNVLATSRAVLHLLGEHEYPVLPLAAPDLSQLPPIDTLGLYPAVDLFVQRSQAVKPDFTLTDANTLAVAEICIRLDGLPLAIELAAARSKLFDPSALLARLRNRLTLLTGGARDLPARQQTLRATLDWSYHLLTAEEQTLFQRLAVFVGGCTLEAAAAVCNVTADPEIAVLDSLATLVDQSLLRQEVGIAGEPQFTMLETIREHALERLEASGEADAIRQRHMHFYLDLVGRADLNDEAQGVWLEQLMADRDNLRVAIRWCETLQSDVEARSSSTTITYYGGRFLSGTEVDRILWRKFTKETGISVQFIEGPLLGHSLDEYEYYLRVCQDRSAGVDVIMLDVIWVSALASYLIDLGPTLATEARRCYPSIVENNTVAGRLVAMPWMFDVGMLYYRTDLLQKYGFTAPPTTWDELEHQAQTIMDGEKSNNPNFVGFVFQGHANEGLTCNALEWLASSGGGRILEQGQVTVNNPQAAAILNRAQRWVGTIAPLQVTEHREWDSARVFWNGNAAFLRYWSLMDGPNRIDDSLIRGRFDVTRLPASPGQPHVGAFGGRQLGILNHAWNQDAAVEFVRYMTRPGVQAYRAVVGDSLPTIPEVANRPEAIRVLPALKHLADIRLVARPAGEVGARYPEVAKAFYQGVHQILKGQDATEVLPLIERRIREIIR